MHVAASRCLAAAALLLGAASRVEAQGTPLTLEQPYRQTLSINPIALPFGAFSGEFERALSPGVTFAIGGTYFDFDDARHGWFEGKALYYPNEVALKGFAVGLTAGYHWATDTGLSPADFFGFEERHKDSGATLGIITDYNWLLGKRNRFLIGLGLGAKRVLKNVSDNSALPQVMLDGRLQMGIAF